MKLSPLVFWGTALAEQSQLICTTGFDCKNLNCIKTLHFFLNFFAILNQPWI